MYSYYRYKEHQAAQKSIAGTLHIVCQLLGWAQPAFNNFQNRISIFILPKLTHKPQ